MGGQARISEAHIESLTEWCVRSGVTLCALFGSRADGSARPESDYDLAIIPAPAPSLRLSWQVALEELLQGDVDLVALSPSTEPVLGWEIARGGWLVYEARPDLWAAERARLWHSYNDALPFRRGLAESLRRFAEEARRAP
jgi:predicted nucleotidyltransferase